MNIACALSSLAQGLVNAIILAMNMSPDSEKLMSQAVKELKKTNGLWLATEHLLLAFLKSKDKVSREVVQPRMKYDEVIGYIGTLMDIKTPHDTPDSPVKTGRLEEALEFAERRAIESGEQVEPLHLFLGLMASGGEARQGIAQHIMVAFEVNPDEWAQEATAVMSS